MSSPEEILFQQLAAALQHDGASAPRVDPELVMTVARSPAARSALSRRLRDANDPSIKVFLRAQVQGAIKRLQQAKREPERRLRQGVFVAKSGGLALLTGVAAGVVLTASTGGLALPLLVGIGGAAGLGYGLSEERSADIEIDRLKDDIFDLESFLTDLN